MRGEYRSFTRNFRSAWELPPRARRIPISYSLRFFAYGTTSACAENTCVRFRFSSGSGNYLRVRGEYALRRPRHDQLWELPPRARRILPLGPSTLTWTGTTSACAENTTFVHTSREKCGNYLRVRGEYITSVYMIEYGMELPPRARRILRQRRQMTVRLGTTSACAENTIPPITPISTGWNYLRVRGEYAFMLAQGSRRSELPPRARRIPGTDTTDGILAGTTSACAENTAGQSMF